MAFYAQLFNDAGPPLAPRADPADTRPVLELLIYLGAGCLAGATAGLFGVGGGIVVVPVLLLIFPVLGVAPAVATHLAIGTSLATVVVTSLGSARGHYRLGAVDMPLLLRLGAGMVAGAVLGTGLAGYLDGVALQRLFGTFLLAVSLYMLSGWQPPRRGGGGGDGVLAGVGGGIGTLSAMVGVSGGTVTVPYLVWRGLAMHRAVGTSSATALPLGLTGALGYLVVGWGEPQLPPGATGYIYWPAFAGIVTASLLASSLAARLAHRVPARRLRRLFAILLLFVALRLLLS
ncbi:sulfite exporter TauE/SafE family protein [Halorhodospira halophila]|uniref:sulfite exporter TauE/SafE family protein n=1 Tax=Halorhodospira TaxID=85108 RepID=UPI001EE8E8D3|nr:sulfite exporter TauE/SafE family protein [Halorhodospira halophila]MCG5543442.1 sulfite exporter TauE/SafE family protein [Halorhodospira sp. 9628]